MFLGVDLGGTKTALCIGTEDGVILEKVQFPTGDPDETIEKILFEGKRLIGNRKIHGIGISCGSPQDSKNGIIQAPPNMPQWIDVPIVKILSEAFGAKAWLANDANACALAEWKYGAGRGVENMLFLTFGTGLGAGIILNGKLYEGTNGMAGEIGHIRLENKGPEGYGKCGSFEGFCSGGGIARLGKEKALLALNAGTPYRFCDTEERIESLTTKDIALAAHNGDENALAIFREVGTRLGQGLSILIDAFNPERIVIGSIFARAEDLIRPSMEEVIQRETLESNRKCCSIVPAALGESIGDMAAVSLAVLGWNSDEDAIWNRYPNLNRCKSQMEQSLYMLKCCVSEGHKILLCGNGGSAADCDHIAGELLKGFVKKRPLSSTICGQWEANYPEDGKKIAQLLQGGIPAISLPSFGPVMTAVSNDTDSDMIFAQLVWALGQPGDVLLALSTSGNARNVCMAAKAAHMKGMRVIAMTGNAVSALSDVADVTIHAPAQQTYQVQEYHLPIYHWLCMELEAYFFEK